MRHDFSLMFAILACLKVKLKMVQYGLAIVPGYAHISDIIAMASICLGVNASVRIP